MKILLAALALALPSAAQNVGSDAAFSATLNAGRSALLKQVAFGREEEQALLDALNDNKPEVRIQALRGLKQYAANSWTTRDKVLDVLSWSTEDAGVRREAARALSGAAGDWKVRDALLARAKSSSDPAAVRAMSYMALYWQAQFDSTVRDAVREAAERERNKEVRLAAIWALMYAGGDSDVRRSLLDLAERSSEGDVARAAAKSLYSQMSDSDVRRYARETAERASGETRYIGIMMLATRSFEEDTRLLEEIAKNDRDAKARQYAVTALAGYSVDVVYFFHQNHYQWMGQHSRLISEAIDRE